MELKAQMVEGSFAHFFRGGCFACFIVRMEVLYQVWKDEGESSGHLAVMAMADQKIHRKMFLKQDPHKNASADRFSKPSSSSLPPGWSRWQH